MSWTKGQIVSEALTEIGIAEYEFDVGPEEKRTALRRLDMMMADWNARGLRLSYPLPFGSTDGSLSDDSNIPDIALEAVVLNLACRLAPSYGKMLSMDTKVLARKAMTTLQAIYAKPSEQRFPQMPKGAGYKHTEWRFTKEPTDPLAVGDDSELDLQGAFNGADNQ